MAQSFVNRKTLHFVDDVFGRQRITSAAQQRCDGVRRRPAEFNGLVYKKTFMGRLLLGTLNQIVMRPRGGSLQGALRRLGNGRSQLVELPIDDAHGIDATATEAALAQGSAPTLLVLQAGDVNTGACDDFGALILLARRHGAWVHVNGAFGLWAAASPRFAGLVRGAADANSWAVDGHKWLNVPYDCGYAFVKDAEAHRTMAWDAAYVTHAAGGRDPMDWNPEWSRRARASAT